MPKICCGLPVGFFCTKSWFSIAITNTVLIPCNVARVKVLVTVTFTTLEVAVNPLLSVATAVNA